MAGSGSGWCCGVNSLQLDFGCAEGGESWLVTESHEDCRWIAGGSGEDCAVDLFCAGVAGRRGREMRRVWDGYADVGLRGAGLASAGCAGGVWDVPVDVPDFPGSCGGGGAVAGGGAGVAGGSGLDWWAAMDLMFAGLTSAAEAALIGGAYGGAEAPPFLFLPCQGQPRRIHIADRRLIEALPFPLLPRQRQPRRIHIADTDCGQTVG